MQNATKMKKNQRILEERDKSQLMKSFRGEKSLNSTAIPFRLHEFLPIEIKIRPRAQS
jgi:hypothetical protein